MLEEGAIKERFEKLFPLVGHPMSAGEKDKYQRNSSLADAILAHFRSDIRGYLQICTGVKYDVQISEAMSFPDKFLKKGARVQQEDLVTHLGETLCLGFYFHNVVIEWLTRTSFRLIDRAQVFSAWKLESLMAKEIVKDLYRKKWGISDAASRFYMGWWASELERFLRNEARLGLWRRGIARSWCENLFFAGALLELHVDAATMRLMKDGQLDVS